MDEGQGQAHARCARMGDDDAALHAVVCERKDGARFCASQKSDVQCGNHQEPSTVWPARAAARGVDERRHALAARVQPGRWFAWSESVADW